MTTRLRELHTTIEAGERHRNAVLQQIAVNLEEWTTKVRSAHPSLLSVGLACHVFLSPVPAVQRSTCSPQ